MPYKPVDQAIKVVLGPCIDDTTFKDREESLTYDQAGMEIDVILEKHDGTVTTTAVTPTSGGVHDWTHTDQGYYELEIPASGGDYDNDTEGILTVVGYCTGVLPFRSQSYDIVPEKVYNSLIEGSDNLEVDLTQILGHLLTQTGTQLADGFEHFFNVATPAITVADAMRGTENANTTTPLDAAGVRAAVGLSSANLDTQLSDIPTVAEFEARTILAAEYFDPASDTVDVGKISGNQMAADVLAARNYSATDDRVVLVADAATDTDRGTALAAAHAAAKALSPTAASWVTVLIPPGGYKLTANLDLDTDYIQYLALEPERGGARSHNDVDIYEGDTSLSYYRPPRTVIYCETADTTTITQSATQIRMRGFGIAQLAASNSSGHALYISGDDNAGSFYDEMYFWNRAASHDASPAAFAKHVKGTWRNCIANAHAWRVGYDAAHEGTFSVTMYGCQAGSYSYGGDYDTLGTHKATGCRLFRCEALGKITIAGTTYPSGYASFCSCGSWSIPIDSTCYFEGCRGGPVCFGVGTTVAGKFVDCYGEYYSFGGTNNASYPGEFSGYAKNCHGGTASFGGRLYTGVGDNGKLSGKLVGCVIEDDLGYNGSLRLEGATIEGCLIETRVNNQDCTTLLDSLSRITDSTLLVVEGGTGVPINAGSALNVCAAGNRYNNLDNNSTGLGANVTNLGIAERQTDAASRTASKADVSGLATTSALEAVGSNVTTVLNRIGTFTGSGVNTILGFFKALMSKTADAPSDLGGTFNPAKDSTESIRDRGDAGWTTGVAGSVVNISTEEIDIHTEESS